MGLARSQLAIFTRLVNPCKIRLSGRGQQGRPRSSTRTTDNHEGAAVGRRITHAVIELANQKPPGPAPSST
jgi:hypothetical protein